MANPNLFTKPIAVAVALVLLASTSFSQTTMPTAALAETYVVTDSRGQHKGIHVEFDVKSDVVVAGLSIAYRVYPNAEYKTSKLKQGQNLRYAGILPEADRIECYLILRPEKGESLNALGSPANPFVIARSDLPLRKEERYSPSKKGVAIIIMVVAAIFGIAIGAAKSSHSK